MTAVPRLFEQVYHKIVKKGKTAGGWKTRLFEWSLGVNWYLNPNVKMQFDYEHTGFRYGAAKGHDRPDESVLLSELQLQF